MVVVAGDGPLRKTLQETTAGLGIGERVRWLGHVDDVGDVIAAADVFCLSSTWEARALAAQEAILLGTPVVATAVGGMIELVEDRQSGRLVPPGDAGALAGALTDVLNDPETASRYVAEARDRLHRAPSESEAVDGLIETYAGFSRA
jgi:glycosyltransferase involved in cell wall biosynthesis